MLTTTSPYLQAVTGMDSNGGAYLFIYLFICLFADDVLLGVNIIHRFTFEAVNNAFFSVDSFFVLRYVTLQVFSTKGSSRNYSGC